MFTIFTFCIKIDMKKGDIVEVKGINKLRKNDYKTIRIANNRLTVTGSDKATLKDKSIFDDIKNLSDEELTNLICSYYSNYHRINYINERLNYKDISLGEVGSLDDTCFRFERPLYKEGAIILLNNYRFNREDFVLNNDTSDISIVVLKGETSYRKIGDSMSFKLNINEEGKLVDIEIEFLNFLLETVFENEKVNVAFEDSALWETIKLESDNHKLNFCTLFLEDERVENIIESFVKKHNKENTRVLQMKMEEF